MRIYPKHLCSEALSSNQMMRQRGWDHEVARCITRHGQHEWCRNEREMKYRAQEWQSQRIRDATQEQHATA